MTHMTSSPPPAPARSITGTPPCGAVEAADADGAVAEAVKEFEVKDPKRSIAVRRGLAHSTSRKIISRLPGINRREALLTRSRVTVFHPPHTRSRRRLAAPVSGRLGLPRC